MTGEKVLIVDDEADVLRSTGMLVEMLGYQPIEISDPGKVIEVAEREHPGVILQDLKMQDLNVAGLVASLRSNPVTADIPLVFFSAGPDLPTVAARHDAWGYLGKPFTEQELGLVLQKSLAPHGPPKAVANSDNVRREVRAAFHDYWNLLAALNNYARILRRQAATKEGTVVIDALEDVVLKLESKTDRLRAYMVSLVG